MIQYTYFELFLICAFFIALGYALKYREESMAGKRFIKALLSHDELYAKVKKEHDAFMKETQNAH